MSESSGSEPELLYSTRALYHNIQLFTRSPLSFRSRNVKLTLFRLVKGGCPADKICFVIGEHP